MARRAKERSSASAGSLAVESIAHNENTMAKYADKNREMRYRLGRLTDEFLKIKKSLAKIDKEMRRLRSAAGVQSDEMLEDCERIDWDEFVSGLSLRARKGLERNGIENAASLAGLTMERICEWKNCGETTVREIEERLAEFGIDLPVE